jgi:hypothetical protein
VAALGQPSAIWRIAPTTQDRECESRLFEGWRETTHWRKFMGNSPQGGGEFRGGRK